ncbi:hypothetical protein BS47DRAFT_1396989 [Hydnum rufescens UP504]|uniref:Uncharacterized protein n=1 Tax=Hydnum rufescens UP504 TaxID=1448309 RepID=A0A9P6DS92_9AGAM|nr:hypothetical protein BS47DRAFT_1396989 [Hydnum rufescens UP504]
MPAPSPALSMISMGPKTDEDPVFVLLIKKEENKTSKGFWPDSVNTSGAIVKQYNNDESSKVDQLVGLSFQCMLDPRLTLHPFIDNFYLQMRIPLNSPPLSTVQMPPYIAKYHPVKSKCEGRECQATYNPDSTATPPNL